MEEKEKENYMNIEDNTIKLNDLPEPEISENEMKEIIEFINNWDYEKYERDSEVREALLLLRSKMKQEEKEKDKKFEELRKKEKNDKKITLIKMMMIYIKKKISKMIINIMMK